MYSEASEYVARKPAGRFFLEHCELIWHMWFMYVMCVHAYIYSTWGPCKMRNHLGKLNAMCVAWCLLLYANQPVWLHDLDMVAEPFPEDEFDFSFCIFNRAVDFIKWPLLLRIDQAKDVHIGGVADDLRRFCLVRGPHLARHCSEHFRSTSKTHRICLSSRDGCICMHAVLLSHPPSLPIYICIYIYIHTPSSLYMHAIAVASVCLAVSAAANPICLQGEGAEGGGCMWCCGGTGCGCGWEGYGGGMVVW